MADQTAQEPTMEEILASIRRIISEDEPAAPAAAAAPEPVELDEEEGGDEVLELTEPADDPVFAAPPAAAEPVEMQGDLEIFTPKPRRPEPAPAPRPEPEPMATFDADDEDDVLVSAPAAASVASAFGQLARHTPMPAPGRSLEDVVTAMLRPMLREWLDQNLPGIVEARVRAEVERLSRGV